jgi:ubiquinone/menaquinone biosynthesis C-methylase UbiE
MLQWNKIFKKNGKVFLRPYKKIIEVADIFKKNNIKRVLDLGCGTGRHTVYLARRGFDVYGIDIAKEGVKMTKSWLKEENLKADLKVGNIYAKLPYQDNFFDAIITTGVIGHSDIAGIRKTIKEMKRILRSNGFVFVNVRKNKKYAKVGSKKILPFGQEKTLCKITGPRTCLPLEGGEKGLIHYNFTKQSLKKEFKNFKIFNIWLGDDKRHLDLLGQLSKRV